MMTAWSSFSTTPWWWMTPRTEHTGDTAHMSWVCASTRTTACSVVQAAKTGPSSNSGWSRFPLGPLLLPSRKQCGAHWILKARCMATQPPPCPWPLELPVRPTRKGEEQTAISNSSSSSLASISPITPRYPSYQRQLRRGPACPSPPACLLARPHTLPHSQDPNSVGRRKAASSRVLNKTTTLGSKSSHPSQPPNCSSTSISNPIRVRPIFSHHLRPHLLGRSSLGVVGCRAGGRHKGAVLLTRTLKTASAWGEEMCRYRAFGGKSMSHTEYKAQRARSILISGWGQKD
mmetsp:Transcript_27185/g.73481  ORF Transcript_27185/g.73481 Transcript_27185/m.73481 type:complete len:289 (+) Transcript_27185:3359-4225(+)